MPLRPYVAAPCSADWDAMSGDARVRHCVHCQRSVYDLSAHTEADAARLLAPTEERRCIRFARRSDGTLVTRAARRRWERVLRPALGTAAAIAAALALLASTVNGSARRSGAGEIMMGEVPPTEPVPQAVEHFEVLSGMMADPEPLVSVPPRPLPGPHSPR